MTTMPTLEITSFSPQDQAEAKSLILAGLEEHWGTLDPTKNPDLDDIAASYAGEIFLLARLDGRIVGTGAVIREDEDTGRVVRMSVAREMRRLGIATRLLDELYAAARARGYSRLVLETTTGWQDAEAFYQHHGFQLTGYAEGNTHFMRSLEP